MSDKKISDLPAAGALADTDVFPLTQVNGTNKATIAGLDSRNDSRYVNVSGDSIAGALTVSLSQVNPATSVNAIYASNTVTGSAGPSAVVRGLLVSTGNTGTGTVTNSTAAEFAPPLGTGPVITANGAVIQNQGRTGVANSVGLNIQPQTASNSGMGLVLGTAQNATMWLAYSSQPTTAAGGIFFGSGFDTNLYRSGAGTLKTDGSLAIGTNPASTGVIRLPNNQHIYARNAANDGNVLALGYSSANQLLVGSSTVVSTAISARDSVIATLNGVQQFALGVNAVYFKDEYWLGAGSTVGLRIATAATEKLGFFGAPPVVRPTGTPAAATDPATTMALVNSLRASLIALGLIS